MYGKVLSMDVCVSGLFQKWMFLFLCIAAFIYLVLFSKIWQREHFKIQDVSRHIIEKQTAFHQKSTTDNALCKNRRQYPLEEDILCLPPIPFMKEYKNPCWKTKESNDLRCLPYFQLIGMTKCASSDLVERILKHPDILGTNGKNDGNKSTMWWGIERYKRMEMKHHDSKKLSIEIYIRYFDQAANIIERTKDTNGFHSVITGDGSIDDMWCHTNWKMIPQNKGLSEPKYLTPHLMHHVNPHTKLLVILRNPVTRMYSMFHFSKRFRVKTKAAFHEAIVKSIDYLQHCLNSSTLRQCIYNKSSYLNSFQAARIYLGFYSVLLKEWFNVFPREQFLIITTEDYEKSIQSHLEQIFEFLKVRKLSTEEMEKLGMLIQRHKHVTKSKLLAGDMWEETRQLLTDLYQPYVRELYQMLQDKRFLWDFKL